MNYLKKLLAVVALTAGVVPMTSAPASAASTKLVECATTGTIVFDNALTTVRDPNGMMHFYWSALCAEEYTNGATGLVNLTGVQDISYDGSCITATLTGSGETGLLVGGLAMTIVSTNGGLFAGQFVLVPNGLNPCGMTSAFAVEVAAGVVPGSIP